MNETRATRLCMKNRVSSFNRNNVEVDRIGSLSDEILTHILTFLSTKESLQTCVLSKRWKNTWAAVPILEIKLKDFLIDDWSGGSDEERRIAVARFERFMTGFLDNRAPTNLERVHYVCDFGFGQPDTSIGWLERVMLLMPLQIHISISYWSDNSLDVPDLTLSCASLQHLSMSLYSEVKTIIKPVSINLPSLTCLELNHVDFPDDFSQKIFMGCPSLERLKLCFCDLYFSSISSEMLKELTLHGGHICEQMQISCPNLVSLFMTTSLKRGGISLKNLSSLVNVDIKLYLYFVDDVPVLNLFGGLSNAAKLKLYLGTPVLTEQLEKDVTNCRNFNNLKKLVMGGRWDQTDNFKLIACLLKHSPNLKELSLLVNESYYQIQAPRQEVSGDVLFQCEYLETVKIGPELGGELSCLSSELINSMIKTLGTYVKKIGNLIIA